MASTTFCPSCGAEYLAGVAECADCHVPLGGAPVEELADETLADDAVVDDAVVDDAVVDDAIVENAVVDDTLAGEDLIDSYASTDRTEPVAGDEVVYDLADWSGDERRQIGLLLSGQRIAHRWEVSTDLVVLEPDSGTVEALIDEVESGTGLPALEAVDDDGGDDQVTYAVMSELYVAADRLQHDPADAALAGEFFLAADAAAVTPAPFGIDPPMWQQVQELAASVAAALESDADDDTIAGDTRALRELLARFV